jgi:hypothetical protein
MGGFSIRSELHGVRYHYANLLTKTVTMGIKRNIETSMVCLLMFNSANSDTKLIE